MSEEPRRILIVLMGSLGDVVRGMCLVDAIKGRAPKTTITWLVEPACAGIVKLHPRIDDVIVFDREQGIRGVFALQRELARRSFDVTLDLQRHLKSGFFSWLSGARRRIGFHRNDAKEGNWLFNTEHISERGESVSKVEHYQLFLEQLGIQQPAMLSSGLAGITLDTIEAPWVSQLRRPYLVCVLGSSWDSKDWPEEGFLGLLARLEGRQVVLVSDKTKVDLAARLEAAATGASVVNLAGKTSLRELVAVIHGAQAVVGPDSGPAHIAGAVGTSHITLFGPTPAVRNAPQGSESLSLTADIGCAPCKRRVCPGLGKVCMKLIHPEAVISKLLEAQSRG
jgi:lipopolysaccharide heptosyltransferase I